MKGTFDLFTFALSKRTLLCAVPAALGLFSAERAIAGPLDSIPMTSGARILRQETMLVSGKSSGAPGIAGADVSSPGRAWLDIDFDVRDNADITLMILTPQQKAQLLAGKKFQGDPLARVKIGGPETANHSVTVEQGNYWVGFLNAESRDVEVVCRISIKTF